MYFENFLHHFGFLLNELSLEFLIPTFHESQKMSMTIEWSIVQNYDGGKSTVLVKELVKTICFTFKGQVQVAIRRVYFDL